MSRMAPGVFPCMITEMCADSGRCGHVSGHLAGAHSCMIRGQYSADASSVNAPNAAMAGPRADGCTASACLWWHPSTIFCGTRTWVRRLEGRGSTAVRSGVSADAMKVIDVGDGAAHGVFALMPRPRFRRVDSLARGAATTSSPCVERVQRHGCGTDRGAPRGPGWPHPGNPYCRAKRLYWGPSHRPFPLGVRSPASLSRRTNSW
jgi:hypothetical protein